MAEGRLWQLRAHAIGQASLVWSMINEVAPDMIANYQLTGSLGQPPPPQKRPPLMDKIIDDIHANGGRLVVDEAKFQRMMQELPSGRA